MTQKKIVFLFGGPGDEHEVSCLTAKSALPEFENHFVVKPVFITKDGQWVVADEYVPAKKSWPRAQTLMKKSGIPAEIALDAIELDMPSVIFIGLHGKYGEDGTLQALLEGRGLAYTGSGVEASALSMDKPRVFQILQDEGVHVPEFLEITSETPPADIQTFADFRGFPLVVLPADSGSSVGVAIAHNHQTIQEALKLARANSDRALITQYIAGTEVTCGLLVTEKNKLISLSPTEVIPTSGHEFWDYEAKYVAGEAEEITPARLPRSMIQTIQDLSRKVHQLVDADGYSRVDMIIGQDNIIYVLEINTLPGMTATSILPQEAQVYGLTFGQLLTTICANVDRSSRDYVTAVD